VNSLNIELEGCYNSFCYQSSVLTYQRIKNLPIDSSIVSHAAVSICTYKLESHHPDVLFIH